MRPGVYIHIPFCENKCPYCSFLVFEKNKISKFENIKIKYARALKTHLKLWKDKLNINQVRTIYFGWGTPLTLGEENLIDITQYVLEIFDPDQIEEISIELNPSPHQKVLKFIKKFNQYFKNIFRIRYSIGIQSLQPEVLKLAWRDYNFISVSTFLRELRNLKQQNNVINLDFIAFGIPRSRNKKDLSKFRHPTYIKFFTDLANSSFVDSFSLYFLELFAWSLWYKYLKQNKLDIKDEDSWEEFNYLKQIITQAGYSRYEVSNFSTSGKESIHNLIYWNLEPYIALWVWWAWFLPQQNGTWIRWENIKNIYEYINIISNDSEEAFSKITKQEVVSHQDLLFEEFFLRLRTKWGIKDISKYTPILQSNRESKIRELATQDLINYAPPALKLTDKGMDLSNEVITLLTS